MSKTDFETELKEHGSIVYPNTGTSMMPLLRQHKDLMIIAPRPEGRLKNNDAVLFRRGNDYVLHRIVKVLPEGYLITGDNQWAKEIVGDEQIIGVLTGFIRDGKEHSVSEPAYRLYVTGIRMIRLPRQAWRILISKLK